MSKDQEFSAIVIGAGPAGCAFALGCATAGMRVALLEAQRFPRVRPGETLHPGVESIFTGLGVFERLCAVGFHRHSGVWVEWEGPRTFQPYGRDAAGPWFGFQADRARLDALLLDAARDAGAEVLQPCRAMGVLRDSCGEIAGVATTAGPIRAKWIADATGRRSWLARELGLAIERHSPRLAVRFGWRDGRGAELDGQPLLQACAGGWDWCAPLGDDRVAWVDLRVPTTDSILPLRESSEARHRHPVPAAGLDLHWRLVPACAGPGYFLLGDAAASLDPSSSHGVLRALMSGILASRLLLATHCGVLKVVESATEYRDWMRHQFQNDTTALREMWERHPCEVTRLAMSGRSQVGDHSGQARQWPDSKTVDVR